VFAIVSFHAHFCVEVKSAPSNMCYETRLPFIMNNVFFFFFSFSSWLPSYYFQISKWAEHRSLLLTMKSCMLSVKWAEWCNITRLHIINSAWGKEEMYWRVLTPSVYRGILFEVILYKKKFQLSYKERFVPKKFLFKTNVLNDNTCLTVIFFLVIKCVYEPFNS